MTVLGVGLIVVMIVLAMVGVQLGAAVVARHRAEAAADLAALASAARAVGGIEAACGAARRVTDRMAAELTGCELRGWDAVVRVAVRPAGPAGGLGVATATARAGPIEVISPPSGTVRARSR